MQGAYVPKRAPIYVPGVWCPLLQHNAAGILSLLHVEHAGKQCEGHRECTCGARVTAVGALVTALRRAVTEYGACGTRPDPMTGNRSLANVVDPPPFGAGATNAAALIALLIELHNIIQECLTGFGLDYVKCFDLIPQQVVLRVAILQGMHEGTHRALSGMYAQLTRCFKIMGCMCSFFVATNGILQGCPLRSSLLTFSQLPGRRCWMRKSRQDRPQPQSSPPMGGGGQLKHCNLSSQPKGMPMIHMVWHQGNTLSSPSWNAHTRGYK